MKRKLNLAKQILTALIMSLLTLGCSSRTAQVCNQPVIVKKPALTPAAQQLPQTESCKPNCSKALQNQLLNMQESLTKID